MTLIAIGTAQFGLNYGIANATGKIVPDDASEILGLAEKNRSNLLDTAIAYGDAESTLGEIGCKSWNVVTKLPDIPPEIEDITSWVYEEVNKSLSRLKIAKLYGLLLHAPSALLGRHGRALTKALLGLKNEGVISKLGVSIYDPTELEDLHDTEVFDIVQSPMNVFDRRLAESGWLAKLSEREVEIHIRSAFLQGLLIMDPKIRSTQFSPWSGLFAMWDKWVFDTNQTRVAACITHLKSYPQVDQIVVGVDHKNQLTEIFEANLQNAQCAPNTISTTDTNLINPSRWPSR